MIRAKFILGEDKYVKIMLHAPNDEPFEISEAFYKLSIYGEQEDSGLALIDGHKIGIKLCPKQKGTYELVFTYKVVDTTRKALVELEVI